MAKRNAQGNGNLRKRKDGLWEARFCYTDEVGQPKRGSVYAKTQKECRQKLTAKLKAIDEETYRKSEKKIKVAEWLKEWFETYCTDLKPQTLKTYESRIRQQLIPHIGDATLQSLTNAQIQRLINRLAAGTKLQKPMAPKTVEVCSRNPPQGPLSSRCVRLHSSQSR